MLDTAKSRKLEPATLCADTSAAYIQDRSRAWNVLVAKSCTLATVVAACWASFSPVAQAQVAGRGTWETTLKARDAAGHAVELESSSAEFFYDTTTNVTWLANMNVIGYVNWSAAKEWAAGLNLGGHSDWRLPNIIDSSSAGCDFSLTGGTDCGSNVQTQVGSAYSEWAHLWYVTLGNKAAYTPDGSPQPPDWGLSNSAYFRNMQSNVYWSGTQYVGPASGAAWGFNTGYGAQNSYGVGSGGVNSAAVRTGDVMLQVPEPSTLLMAGSGLGALVLVRRRRKAP